MQASKNITTKRWQAVVYIYGLVKVSAFLHQINFRVIWQDITSLTGVLSGEMGNKNIPPQPWK